MKKIACFIILTFFRSSIIFGQITSEEVFSSIYSDNIWIKGSGPGSTIEQGRPFITFVQQILDEFDIQSIVDLGCGDWVLAHEINWKNRNYLGLDVVSKVIDRNKLLYSSCNIQFSKLDGITQELPQSDLLICKNVLQHLPNADILKILAQIKKYKYVVIVNDFNANNSFTNYDTSLGGTALWTCQNLLLTLQGKNSFFINLEQS